MKTLSPRKAFLFILGIYLLTAAGHIDTIDADPSIETAYAVLEHQSLATHPERPDPMLYRATAAGEVSKMGWVLPALYVPYIVLAKVLAFFVSLPERLLAEFFISFVNVFITLGILILVYTHLSWSGHKSSQALLICVILGLGTLLFPYAKTAHREPIQALLLTALAVAVLNDAKIKRAAGFWVGLLVALGYLTKMALWVPMLPLSALYLIRTNRKNRLLFLVSPLLAVLLQALIAQHYFGSPLKNGYSKEVLTLSSQVWSTPLARGIFEQWFSWESGLLIHCPIVILALILFLADMAKQRRLSTNAILLIVIAAQTLLYARWFSPSGGAALGPRYLVVVLPLFALLLPRQEWQLSPSTQIRFFVLLLLSWSFFQQTVNASVKPQQYWSMRALSDKGLPMPHWMANIELFFHKSEAGTELYDPETFGGEGNAVDLRSFKSLSGLNYWWLHASRLWTENQPFQKSLPKTITIGQVHRRG